MLAALDKTVKLKVFYMMMSLDVQVSLIKKKVQFKKNTKCIVE